MKIQNKSKWDTDELRDFFRLVFKKEGISPKRYNITVMNTRFPRKDCCTGCAYLHSKTLTIRLPTMERVMGSDGFSRCVDSEVMPIPKTVAQVLAHEIHHTIGYQHREMIKSEDILTPENLPVIHKKKRKINPKRNFVKERYEHAKKKLLEWQRKETRAMKLRKKWAKKVGYYEKKGT